MAGPDPGKGGAQAEGGDHRENFAAPVGSDLRLEKCAKVVREQLVQLFPRRRARGAARVTGGGRRGRRG